MPHTTLINIVFGWLASILSEANSWSCLAWVK